MDPFKDVARERARESARSPARSWPLRRAAPLALLAALTVACIGPQARLRDAEYASARPGPAAAVFQRLVALQGDWLDADGTMTGKGQLAATWRVTGGGSAVVETLFPGQPEEMLTVYHRDGDALVLTHYCSGGNQPRMRAESITENAVVFAFTDGANIDPARDQHMHAGRIEFVSADELRAEWQGWVDGRPAPEHLARFHLVRRKS
jgi:hypothetical protein